MNMYKRLTQRSALGFTLLELLVVVAIIGFLSTVAIVALSVAQANQRDTQRLLDQATILKAVELAISDTGTVPSQLRRTGLLYEEDQGLERDQGPKFNFDAGQRGPQSWQPQWSLKLIRPAQAQPCMCNSPPLCLPVLTILLPNEDCDQACARVRGTCPVYTCGNDMCESAQGENSSNCFQDCHCGDAICQQSAPANETTANCAVDCYCGNGICDNGENYQTCSQDCSSGSTSGGSTPTTCGNNVCDQGETPGNCPSDCTNYAQCYIGGEWDLCCLFGGQNCSRDPDQQGTGGYYGVCNGDRCEQRYLLQPPAYDCRKPDYACVPNSTDSEKMFRDQFISQEDPEYLQGLERYIIVPKNQRTTKQGRCAYYYATTHPEIVGTHGFCFYWCFERREALWPYTDLIYTPDGIQTTYPQWSVACTR